MDLNTYNPVKGPLMVEKEGDFYTVYIWDNKSETYIPKDEDESKWSLLQDVKFHENLVYVYDLDEWSNILSNHDYHNVTEKGDFLFDPDTRELVTPSILQDKINEWIQAWDKKDIKDLLELIRLDTYVESLSRTPSRVDYSDLPSIDIPDWVDTGYPVWAMDEHENCLVGSTANEIESLSDLKEIMMN